MTLSSPRFSGLRALGNLHHPLHARIITKPDHDLLHSQRFCNEQRTFLFQTGRRLILTRLLHHQSSGLSGAILVSIDRAEVILMLSQRLLCFLREMKNPTKPQLHNQFGLIKAHLRKTCPLVAMAAASLKPFSMVNYKKYDSCSNQETCVTIITMILVLIKKHM